MIFYIPNETRFILVNNETEEVCQVASYCGSDLIFGPDNPKLFKSKKGVIRRSDYQKLIDKKVWEFKEIQVKYEVK